MSCRVISDEDFVTPGFRCEPSLRANAARPAAVRPPFGSFSRAAPGLFLAAFFFKDFFAVFLAERLRAAFLAGLFLAVLAFTVVFGLVAASTFLRPAESSADRTTVTPSSLRSLSRAFRCWGEMSALSLVPRTASAVTWPVDLPRSTSATTSGCARTSAGSLRDVLDDTNYLS